MLDVYPRKKQILLRENQWSQTSHGGGENYPPHKAVLRCILEGSQFLSISFFFYFWERNVSILRPFT